MADLSTISLQNIEIKSIDPSLVAISHSGKRQIRNRSAQRWMISGTYPKTDRDTFDPVWVYALSQKGQFSSFSYIPPIYSNAKGDVSACSSAVEVAGSTAVTVTMTGTLKAGDYVKFASHDKVYIVTSDLTGNGELNIYPALQAATTAAAVTYDSVPFTVAFVSNEQSFSRGPNDLHDYRIQLVEII
jgi:hypothetical protein